MMNSEGWSKPFSRTSIQSYDSAVAVKPVLFRIRPLMAARPTRASYRENTHVISVTYPHGVEISYFAPFATPEKVFYAVVRGPAKAVKGISFQCDHAEAKPLIDSAMFTLQKGTVEKYFLFGFIDTLHHDPMVVQRAKERLLETNGGLLESEVRWMRSVIAGARLPHGITATERNVLEQSIAVLVMAQVAPGGDLPESQRTDPRFVLPGVWNISWVRDGMYSILGLDRLGLFSHARKFWSSV